MGTQSIHTYMHANIDACNMYTCMYIQVNLSIYTYTHDSCSVFIHMHMHTKYIHLRRISSAPWRCGRRPASFVSNPPKGASTLRQTCASLFRRVAWGSLRFLIFITSLYISGCLVSGMACGIVNFFSSWMGFSTFHMKIRKKAQKTVAWCEANPGHTRCRGSTVLPGFRSTRQLERNYHPS